MSSRINEFYPWNFNLEEQLSNYDLFVIYGKDLSLSLSLSRLNNSDFWDESALRDDMSLLYTQSLFDNTRQCRILMSGKFCEQAIKKYVNREFAKKVVLIVDSSSVSTKVENVCYVKCDELNRKSRKSFIEFWNRQIKVSIDSSSQVRNLDEFKMSVLLQQFGFDSKLEHMYEPQSVWNLIRTEQFRSGKLYQPIYKHLELWARNNVPNEETLQLCYEKVKSEIERFKSEVSQGN